MIRRPAVMVAVALLGAAAIAQEVVGGSGGLPAKDASRPVVAIDPVPPGLLPVSERVRRLDLSGLEASDPAFAVVQGETGVTISGIAQGQTRGVFLRIPDDLTQTASGRAVMVTVSLIGAEGRALLAYASAGQGDPDWRPVAVSPQGSFSSYDYVVAQGEGSWIGILPDPEGTGQSVIVAEIKVEILD